MDDTSTGVGDTGEPAGAGGSEADPNRPVIVDRRTSSRIKYGELEPSTDKSTPSRLSNVRWPAGQEPYHNTPGSDGHIGVHEVGSLSEVADGEWVNVKLDVTEHLPAAPNQRDLLGGGPDLILKCFYCQEPLHIAAEKSAREVLEEGGYVFDKKTPDGLEDAAVVACVCRNGHVTQFRSDFVGSLVKRS